MKEILKIKKNKKFSKFEILYNHRRKIINGIKKKQYSGNSVIMKYGVSNTSRIFLEG
jgi:hypothetical protein